MKNICVVCKKEFEALRASKTTCSDTCRQKLHREGLTVTKVVPIVTKKEVTVTGNPTVTSIVTDREVEKKLVFTDEPMDVRVKMYKDLYPDSTFVPNWVANGFNSKEEALKAAIRAVQKNQGIVKMGLGND